MAAWESLFAQGIVTGVQDTPFSFDNTVSPVLKCDEVTRLVSLDDIRAAKFNFSLLSKTYKASHKNIEELEKQVNVLHTKITQLGLIKTDIINNGVMGKLNNELMLNEIMKPEKYTELYTSLINSENEVLKNIDLKQTQYKSDLSTIALQIKENKDVIEELEKIIKFIKNDVNIEELKVAPAIISTVECGICKCSQVEYALRSCGHTYCKECLDTLKNKCSYCNAAIIEGGAGLKALRVYFPG